jgi:hypothetical protein
LGGPADLKTALGLLAWLSFFRALPWYSSCALIFPKEPPRAASSQSAAGCQDINRLKAGYTAEG